MYLPWCLKTEVFYLKTCHQFIWQSLSVCLFSPYVYVCVTILSFSCNITSYLPFLLNGRWSRQHVESRCHCVNYFPPRGLYLINVNKQFNLYLPIFITSNLLAFISPLPCWPVSYFGQVLWNYSQPDLFTESQNCCKEPLKIF